MSRDRLVSWLPGAAVLLVIAGLFWLNRREGVEHVRLALACGIGLAGLAFLWRGRHGFWQPPLAIALTGAALVVLQATSPDVVSRHFEAFVGRFGSFLLAAFLAWVWVRQVLPRVDAKFQAVGVMAFSAALSAALVLTALSIWMKAVNIYSWRELPVVSTAEDFLQQMDRSWGARANGILVEGILTDAQGRTEAVEDEERFVAYYNGLRRIGGKMRRADGPVWFPIFLDLRLADGTVLQAASIQNSRGAVNWPECGPRLHQHCLRVGDRVVIHGDPYWLTRQDDGAQLPSLGDVRAVVWGDLAAAEARYVAPAIGNARVFGWIALALVPLGFLPGVIGIRRGLWLRRHGSDREGGVTIS
ncbi:MAG: hypothetical protein Kow0013_29710 [Pararhodobacter sp.]